MADERIEDVIARYLGMGDIARTRDAPDGGYLSTERQIHRIGPDNRDSTRHMNLKFSDGTLPLGVSKQYMDRKYDDFIGADGFDNRPSLLYSEPDREGYTGFDLARPSGVNPEVNRLELYMGEALALQRKAEAGEASAEELDLLDAYNEFLRLRTGV